MINSIVIFTQEKGKSNLGVTEDISNRKCFNGMMWTALEELSGDLGSDSKLSTN